MVDPWTAEIKGLAAMDVAPVYRTALQGNFQVLDHADAHAFAGNVSAPLHPMLASYACNLTSYACNFRRLAGSLFSFKHQE